MNVLFVNARFPLPADTGSKIRAYNLLKNVAERHEVAFVTFSENAGDVERAKELRAFCSDVILVPHRFPKSTLRVGCGLVANLFMSRPYTIGKYRSRAMRSEIERVLNERPVDLIHCDSLHTAQNLPETSLPKILGEHNVEYVIAERLRETVGNSCARAYVNLQALRMKRYEAATCVRFDRCITVSAEDARILRALAPKARVEVIDNGVDTEYFTLQDKAAIPDRLVFTGSMDWLPNVDAMEYFCGDILPRIERNHPEISLSIVGRNPPPRVCALAKPGRVDVTGSVPDVRPYIAEAALYVVPLRIGGGSRLKILEALAMGVPCVSTSVGCEGLRVEHGRHVWVADGPSEFAEGVERLLTDAVLRKRLAEAGRKLVVEEYDWKQLGAKLADLYEEVLRGRVTASLARKARSRRSLHARRHRSTESSNGGGGQPS